MHNFFSISQEAKWSATLRSFSPFKTKISGTVHYRQLSIVLDIMLSRSSWINHSDENVWHLFGHVLWRRRWISERPIRSHRWYEGVHSFRFVAITRFGPSRRNRARLCFRNRALFLSQKRLFKILINHVSWDTRACARELKHHTYQQKNIRKSWTNASWIAALGEEVFPSRVLSIMDVLRQYEVVLSITSLYAKDIFYKSTRIFCIEKCTYSFISPSSGNNIYEDNP